MLHYITWEHVKKFLHKRNMIEEVCNKGTENELIIDWKGAILMKDYPYMWVSIMYRSTQPRTIVKLDGSFVRYEYPEGYKPKKSQLTLF